MNPPRITVIIANYNRAELLREAIESVVEQTLQDWELIVFDDGSEDDSLEVVESFQAKDPERIRLCTHEGGGNRGIVNTYREAISQSRTDFIAFLENDDRWSAGYLENKLRILEQHPEVGVVFSPYKIVGDGWFGRDMVLRRWLLRPFIRAGRPFDNFHNLLQCNNVATFSCYATRKSLLENLPVPHEYILAYDWWVLTQLSINSLFYYDDSSVTYWRWSRQSAIGKQRFTEHKSSGCHFMELMYQQVDLNDDSMPEDKKVVFEQYREDFGYFIDYYRKPGPMKFLRFFFRAPMWSLAATASLVINFLKFR